jgi:small-conductance mechanosensitive channel
VSSSAAFCASSTPKRLALIAALLTAILPRTASTSELATLDRATHLVSSQYSEVKDNLADLDTFYATYAAQVAALRPHLDHIDALTAVVGQLEESARTLDGQTKQLEAAIADILL